MAEGSGSNALLGVIIGAVLVGVVLLFVFNDGFGLWGGNGGDIDVNIDVPAVTVTP